MLLNVVSPTFSPLLQIRIGNKVTFWTNVKQGTIEHNTVIIEYSQIPPTQNTPLGKPNWREQSPADHRSHSKSGPSAKQPLFDYLKSRPVWISDPQCI